MRANSNVRSAAAVCLVLLATAMAPAPQQESAPASQPATTQAEGGLPAPLRGLSDEGTFYLFKNEERLATSQFKLRPDGSFEAENALAFAGQSVKTTLKITPDADGRWQKMEIEAPRGPVAIERDGSTARIKHADKTNTFVIKPDCMLFENLSPVLMMHAVSRYDAQTGGQQSFPLFIIPAVQMEGSLTLKDTVERTIGGRDVKFTRYTYGVPGVDIEVWVDGEGKLCFADVPAQRAAYVRQGYESLRQTAADDPLLSKPEHEVVEERGVGVPMRDGVKLATDIYRPKQEGRFPVILIRTPYKKEMTELDGRFYARRGYVVAVQDCRGRFGSPGTWEPFINEPKDGYDTIEWLAGQPWSSGKVGMIGASYLGWVQWWAAGQNPPHLTTIIPNVAPPDPFYNIPYEYGVFFLMGAIWWADVLETEATADLSGVALSKIFEKKYAKLLRALPVIDLDKAVLGQENPYWRKWIEHPTNDEYWQRASFLDRLARVNIPVFHQSGWFDGDGIGSKLNYLRMASHGHPDQKLVLGPWGHTPEAHRRVGDRDFGPAAIVDLPRQYLRWFDHWLKGIDNGMAREPLVSLFVMGSNRWLHGPTYPLPQTRFEKWYLVSGGKANTSTGNGRLAPDPPPTDSPPDQYTYDPADPTPTPSYYEEPEIEQDETGAPQERSLEERKRAAERRHEEVTRARPDILVYQSAPLEQPLTFAGPLSAVLYASSSAKDTDWFVRLMEVEQDGKLFPLAEGKIRARFRESLSKPVLLEPGRIYEYRLDLWQTGITLPAGHRLRVEVASASLPVFSRNLNTGGHNEKETDFVAAEQRIYHDAAHPSHVLLPVIPEAFPEP